MNGGNELHRTLEQLLERLERLRLERHRALEQAARTSAHLERLAEIITKLEEQKAREAELAGRLEKLAVQLEKLQLVGTRGVGDLRTLEETIKGIVVGAKTVGQVMEIIAGGVQNIIESLARTVNENKAAITRGPYLSNSVSGGTHLDWQKLLQPLNSLLTNGETRGGKGEEGSNEPGNQ